MNEGMLALPGPAGRGVPLELLERGDELAGRDPQPLGAVVEAPRCAGVGPRVRHEREIVGEVRAGAGEPEPLGRDGDSVRQGHRVAATLLADLLCQSLETSLDLEDRPGERGRIPAVEDDRIEAVQAQMAHQPADPTLLGHRRTLVDAPAVLDHDRDDEARVLGPPPARGPVPAPLLLEGAVGQEHHQALSRQWHVHPLQLREPQIAALGQSPGRVSVHVAAEG